MHDRAMRCISYINRDLVRHGNPEYVYIAERKLSLDPNIFFDTVAENST